VNKLLTLAISFGMISTLSGCAFTTIEPGSVGIKQELGKVEPRLYEPGFEMYNPFTQKFIIQSIQKVTMASADENNSLSRSAATIDQLPIEVQYSVIYYIPKDQVLPLYVGVKGDPFESLVAPRVNEALRTVVAQYRSDEVTAKSEEIQQKVASLANKLVGQSVEIVDVPITHIELPESIRNAVADKQKMEVESRQEQFKLTKERISAEIKVVKARADAESIRVQAEALKQNPDLIKLKMTEVELAKAEKWDGSLPSTVVSSGSNMLFSLK
jgi:prohibitin 2